MYPGVSGVLSSAAPYEVDAKVAGRRPPNAQNNRLCLPAEIHELSQSCSRAARFMQPSGEGHRNARK